MTTAAIVVLAWLCVVLVLLLIGRDRGARRAEARLDRIANDLAEQLSGEQVKVRHLREQVVGYRAEVAQLATDNSRLRRRVEEQRDQLDAAAGVGIQPSLSEEFLAWLANEPITYPEDPR